MAEAPNQTEVRPKTVQPHADFLQRMDIFCKATLEGHPRYKAYILSHPGSENIEKKNINRRASKLYTDPRTQAHLTALRSQAIEKHEVTVQAVLDELALRAFYNPADFFDAKGKLIPLHMLPEALQRVVTQIDTLANRGRGEVKRLKFANKDTALDKLGQFLKMWTERHEHSGAGGGPLEVKTITSDMSQEEAAALYQQALTGKTH